MKVCSRCKIDKPIEDFYKNKSEKIGTQSHCKECDKKRRSKGIVDKRKELESQGLKRCPRCNEIKSTELFYRCKDKFSAHCAECMRILNKQRPKDENRKRYKKTKESLRNQALKRKFGINSDEYDKLSERQNHVCLICDGVNKDRLLAVDHCHTTGRVRGLLCTACNIGIGLFKDDIDTLKRVIEYLEEHQNKE